MIIQLEISNPKDAELILSMVKRLNIPFKETTQIAVGKMNAKKQLSDSVNSNQVKPLHLGMV